MILKTLVSRGVFVCFVALFLSEGLLLALQVQFTLSGNRKVCFCFQKDFKGVSRDAWLLSKILLPVHSSILTHKFQSKQQLVMFSSLQYTVDPLQKACNSPHTDPGNILTYCFSYIHSAALAKQLCCDEKQLPPSFKPHRTLHLMSIKFPCAKYHEIMALT